MPYKRITDLPQQHQLIHQCNQQQTKMFKIVSISVFPLFKFWRFLLQVAVVFAAILAVAFAAPQPQPAPKPSQLLTYTPLTYTAPLAYSAQYQYSAPAYTGLYSAPLTYSAYSPSVIV